MLEGLSEVLCAELTAINQYFVHHAMVENMGYAKLANAIRRESIDEMKHAEMLVERILFFDGIPNMQMYEKLSVGANVPEMLQNDLDLELEAVKRLQALVAEFQKVGDYGSAEMLTTILTDEERHVDFLETQLSLIESLGLQVYLSQQFQAADAQ